MEKGSSPSYIYGRTLDDVLMVVVKQILAKGAWINPSKGACKEITGVLLEISDSRARFSRTESRGKPFSSLGELCWYLAKNNDLEFIVYYISKYKKSAEGSSIYGGYGPRLFDWKGMNQISHVISLLRRNPESRKAVIQLFDATDILEKHEDVPCTCTLQFVIRDNKLNLITYMRSNDAIVGLPHDVFCFTMLQEIVARTLNVELGSYKHCVGSLHIYSDDVTEAKQYVKEGWQPTNMSMPPMPLGDPWSAIQLLLTAEKEIRSSGGLSSFELSVLDPYWADLIRLLQIYRCIRDNNKQGISDFRKQMMSNVYMSFIDKRLRTL